MYCILTREIYFDDDGWTVYEIMYCCLLALVEMWYLIIILNSTTSTTKRTTQHFFNNVLKNSLSVGGTLSRLHKSHRMSHDINGNK